MDKQYRAFIFDMDGVFRCGHEVISGASEIVEYISDKGVPSILLTNECRYTNQQLIDDLQGMGVNIPNSWQIYTAGNCVADFLANIKNLDYVSILGEQGLKDTLTSIPSLKDKIRTKLPSKHLTLDHELYVVVGSLNKINQEELEEIAKWIRCGAKVITTCPDLSDPGSKGQHVISMPSYTINLINKYIPCQTYCLGKPNPIMLRKALILLRDQVPDIKEHEILFVGDSLDTDIKMAFELGLDSALVLTGNTTMFMIKSNIIQPTYIFHSVLEIKDELADTSSSSSSEE
jgi:HAD superfamily hydrolase (TIGR01450 family)